MVWGLFLCFWTAVVVLWLRSYFGCETFTVVHSQAFAASSWRGSILLSVTSWETVSADAVRSEVGGNSGWSVQYSRTAANGGDSWPTMKFGFGKYEAKSANMLHMSTVRRTETGVIIPFWLPTCFITLGVLWQLRRCKPHRAEGHCQNCGYDLRGTPERCPECGRAAVA